MRTLGLGLGLSLGGPHIPPDAGNLNALFPQPTAALNGNLGFPGTLSATFPTPVAALNCTYLDPKAIVGADLAVWLRALDASTIHVTSSKITQWDDQSGNANHAVQALSANQPSSTLTTIGSTAAIAFVAGTKQEFNLSATLATLTAGHVFIVFKKTSAVPADTAHAGLMALGFSGSSPLYPWTDGNIYDDCGRTTRPAIGAPVSAFNLATCYEISSASGAWTSYVNGHQQSTTGTNTVHFAAVPYIGADTLPASAIAWLDGAIAEVIIAKNPSAPLGSTARNQVRSYLGKLYGITMGSD